MKQIHAGVEIRDRGGWIGCHPCLAWGHASQDINHLVLRLRTRRPLEEKKIIKSLAGHGGHYYLAQGLQRAAG